MKIIGILPKSPHPEGRIGREEDQDWYCQVLMAKKLYDSDRSNAKIVVSSASKFSKLEEATYYANALAKLGVPFQVRMEGLETIGHLFALKKVAAEFRASLLVIIVTEAHYRRVKWICDREGIMAEIIATAGLPRPSERRTDFVLTFAYPILDLVGLKGWFQRKVIGRRNEGIL